MEFSQYRERLNSELEKRKEINPSYSLRSFARDLDVSAPMLSQVLTGKAGLSQKNAEKIGKRIKLSNKELEIFLSSVASQHARKTKDKLEAQRRINEIRSRSQEFNQIQLEYFKVIADWYHYAILELTHLEGFQKDISWISESLGITEEEAESAIGRLIKLGLLNETEDSYIDNFNQLATPSDIPSASLQKFNSQLLKKANEALYSQGVDEREASANIISIDKRDLLELKKRIREFRRNVDNDLTYQKKDSVYCLSINLFNLTTNLEIEK